MRVLDTNHLSELGYGTLAGLRLRDRLLDSLQDAAITDAASIAPKREYGVWCIPYMKVTFELPPPIVERLRSHIPSGERSRFVADLIAKKLNGKASALEQAARKANRLVKVKREMKAWEALNESED